MLKVYHGTKQESPEQPARGAREFIGQPPDALFVHIGLASQTQAPGDFQRQPRLVHRVEVQARCAAGQQALTQLGDHIEAEGLD